MELKVYINGKAYVLLNPLFYVRVFCSTKEAHELGLYNIASSGQLSTVSCPNTIAIRSSWLPVKVLTGKR